MAPPPLQQAAASQLLQAGPSANAASVLSAFGFLPRHAPSCDRGAFHPVERSAYRRPPSHVPCKSSRPGSRRLYAGHHLASTRVSRQAHPEGGTRTLGFDAICSLSRRLNGDAHPGYPRSDASGTSSWSPPDASCAPFPCRSPRRSSANAAQGGLTPAPVGRHRRAKTSISCTAPLPKDLLHVSSFSVRDAPSQNARTYTPIWQSTPSTRTAGSPIGGSRPPCLSTRTALPPASETSSRP